jgi:DNA-binding NtrC family response regulator/pSer/pThr/pTyr-binding forkhead associated (FHA) protein
MPPEDKPTRSLADDPPGHEQSTELDASGVADEAAIAADHVYLVLKSAERRRVIEVADGDALSFGRDADCDVVIDESKVSRRHFRIERSGSALTLADLDSTNGTRLNGMVLRGSERRLVGGDVIGVGKSELTVAAASGSGLAGAGAVSRLALELDRLAGSGGSATLLRIDLPPDASSEGFERMLGALNGVALIEERDEGQYAALLDAEDGATLEAVRARIVELVPQAEVASAAFPEDGRSMAALWRAADRQADDETSALPRGVVVADPAMTKVFAVAQRVAQTDTTVLVLGETGSGKELLAEQVHRHSRRAEKPFVRLNCASLPETLLASELFGHERGAFTGADRRKVGYFEAASGGTLLLDEIGELSLAMQVKLLRVLESRTVLRLGATSELPVDVRVICATHRDLALDVKEGRFREDLYYRVSAFTLRVPPLRERPTEIGLLAELFAKQMAERMGRPPPELSHAALAALTSHRWPGNVRELRNAIEHASVMGEGAEILPEHLPETLRTPAAPGEEEVSSSSSVRDKLAQIERASILKALAHEGGNQTRAAKRLGMSRRALIYKMGKYGIKRSAS